MPITRPMVERHLAALNAARRPDQPVRLESYQDPARFVLSFPNRSMPEGQCIDQDFTDIQFALLESEKVFTGIQNGRLDETSDRYWIEYEEIVWD
jgi:hypothetical protein